MIDPLLSLAFTMHSAKGTYALLLGSGVSRAAQVPTGWDIVLDLAGKIARLSGEECGPDPVAWYRGKFGQEPDYSALLDSLARSPEERQRLLRAYFEATEDDREQGIKRPAAAHRAIAELVASNHVRVILTTNFDRLIERAIEEAGVVPTVLSTPDLIRGALPLVHQRCCVVKLHGDYLDPRIKNTAAELTSYDDSVNHLVDQVLDEFGLIVSGWSGEYDQALRAALERCKSRRFTTYWTARGKPTGAAARLVATRSAQVIAIKDADTFFRQLADQVTSLDESHTPHPVTVQAAAATMKRYIAEDRHRIRVSDIVDHAAEEAFQKLFDYNDQWLRDTSKASNPDKIRRYLEVTQILRALLVEGCYWGGAVHEDVWPASIQRISRDAWSGKGGSVPNALFRLYPAVALMYTGGLAAIASAHYGTLAALFLKAVVRDYGAPQPLLITFPWGEMKNLAKQCLNGQKYHTPVAEHFHTVCRESLRRYCPDDAEYEALFDRYEYLQGLVHADLRAQGDPDGMIWGPLGRFAWKSRHGADGEVIAKILDDELAQDGGDWPPLRAGLFGGSLDRVKAIKPKFDEMARNQFFE